MTARRQEKRKREGHFYESEDEEGFDASVGSSGGCEDSKDGITSVMSITCNACRQKKTKVNFPPVYASPVGILDSILNSAPQTNPAVRPVPKLERCAFIVSCLQPVCVFFSDVA